MSLFVRSAILILLLIKMSVATKVFSQESKPDVSVAELRAVLQSIPPYLPAGEIKSEIDAFGSTSMDSLCHGWAIGFKKFHPESKVVISAEGSESVFDRLADNPASIGMLSRPVTEADLEELKERGLKRPVAVMVARDALGVFVHQKNPLESISYAQLIELFCCEDEDTGDSINWGTVGLTNQWSEKPVALAGRDSSSGTRAFLQRFVFGGRTMRAATVTADSNAKLLGELEKNPLGIAISDLKCGNHSARLVPLRADKALIPSDERSILMGRYPLTRPLTLVFDAGSNTDRAKANREFIRYALSHPGQMQSILSGFFPFDPPTLRAQQLKVDSTSSTNPAPEELGQSEIGK